jgi:hypothetical protein
MLDEAEDADLYVALTKVMQVNSLSPEQLLGTFFDETMMSRYCEERLAKSGKGGTATLAARIAAAWAKPSFEPVGGIKTTKEVEKPTVAKKAQPAGKPSIEPVGGIKMTKDEKPTVAKKAQPAGKPPAPSKPIALPEPRLVSKEWTGEGPAPSKKAFTHFCNAARKTIKSSLPETQRKDKSAVNASLLEHWGQLDSEVREGWQEVEDEDARRFAEEGGV